MEDKNKKIDQDTIQGIVDATDISDKDIQNVVGGSDQETVDKIMYNGVKGGLTC